MKGWYVASEHSDRILGPFKTWAEASQARIDYYAWVARRVAMKRAQAERRSEQERAFAAKKQAIIARRTHQKRGFKLADVVRWAA
jgi:hypothetical protein